MYVLQYNGRPCVREKITPGNTATGITSTVYAPTSGTYKGLLAKTAVIQNQGTGTAKVNITSAAPTAAAGTDVGMLLTQNNTIVLDTFEAIKAFKAIDNVSGETSKLEVWCYF